jgi:hypothetical protein
MEANSIFVLRASTIESCSSEKLETSDVILLMTFSPAPLAGLFFRFIKLERPGGRLNALGPRYPTNHLGGLRYASTADRLGGLDIREFILTTLRRLCARACLSGLRLFLCCNPLELRTPRFGLRFRYQDISFLGHAGSQDFIGSVCASAQAGGAILFEPLR